MAEKNGLTGLKPNVKFSKLLRRASCKQKLMQFDLTLISLSLETAS